MVPVLRHGDIAIFENRRYHTGDVVQAFKDGEDCVKAIREIKGEVILCSFNPDGPMFPANGWSAKGVCVGRIRYGKSKVRHVTEYPNGLNWSMRDDDD